MSVHKVYVGLGSNLGDSREILRHAWEVAGTHPKVQTRILASPYQTEPVGMVTDHWFVNSVGLLETSLSPDELLQWLQEIEVQAGRRRAPGHTGYQDRSLDLDLLLYDACTLNTQELTIPHPHMTDRLFVLEPLCAICPADLVHPVTGMTFHAHRIECRISQPDYSLQKMQWHR